MNYNKDLKIAIYLYKEMIKTEDVDKAREYREFILKMAELYKRDKVDIFDDIYREWEKETKGKGD